MERFSKIGCNIMKLLNKTWNGMEERYSTSEVSFRSTPISWGPHWNAEGKL